MCARGCVCVWVGGGTRALARLKAAFGEPRSLCVQELKSESVFQGFKPRFFVSFFTVRVGSRRVSCFKGFAVRFWGFL